MAAFGQFLRGSSSLQQPRKVWLVEWRAVRRNGGGAPRPTQPPNFQRSLNSHSTTHDNNGGGSLRHPPSGVCGRESCQSLWGGRAPTPTRPLHLHEHQSTIHKLITNTGATARSDTHPSACVQERVVRRCGHEAPTRPRPLKLSRCGLLCELKTTGSPPIF